jgi:hypothetical protein
LGQQTLPADSALAAQLVMQQLALQRAEGSRSVLWRANTKVSKGDPVVKIHHLLPYTM